MIIDIRDYRLAPGKRDQLIERCETLLFDEQERMGARFVGSFRDADDPDRFVFLRAMPDLETRKRVLTAFYSDGEMWRDNRDEVNSWLVDTDDVLLVHPVSEFAAPATGPSVVGMYARVGKQPLAGADELRLDVEAAIAAAGGRLLVTLETDPAENNYPRHPIREGEHGLVWFATFAAYRPLALAGVVQRRLLPTARSRMR
jgi:NIPSNAP protein